MVYNFMILRTIMRYFNHSKHFVVPISQKHISSIENGLVYRTFNFGYVRRSIKDVSARSTAALLTGSTTALFGRRPKFQL